jgi:hypothetical protein
MQERWWAGGIRFAARVPSARIRGEGIALRKQIFSIAIVLVAGADASAQEQSFYQSVLQRGLESYAAGDFVAAARQLRIASFGFLDSVPEYQRALIYLALAQEKSNQGLDAEATVRKLYESEQVRRTYMALPIENDVRREFEALLARHLSEAQLAFVRSPGALPPSVQTPRTVEGSPAVPSPSPQPPPIVESEQERVARENAARQEQERIAREAAARAEQERIAREAAARAEQERIAREDAARSEQERVARENAARADQERVARENAARADQERVARENAARAGQERVARENAERERLAREAAQRETAARTSEEERIAREAAERERALNAERERIAREVAERERIAREEDARREAARREELERSRTQQVDRETAEAERIAAQERAMRQLAARGATTTLPENLPAASGRGSATTVRRLEEADRLLESGEVEAAREIYRQLVVLPSLSRTEALRVGEGFYRLTDFADSLVAFSRLRTLGESEEVSRYYVAVALYEVGEYAAAKLQMQCALPYIQPNEEVLRYWVKIDNAR